MPGYKTLGSFLLVALTGAAIALVATHQSARADGDDPLDQVLPAADAQAVRSQLSALFDTLSKEGTDAALEMVAKRASFDPSSLGSAIRALEASPNYGRPQAWEVVTASTMGSLGRWCEVRVITYHKAVPAGWRITFYRQQDGLWSFLGLEVQSGYVSSLVDLTELEYDAYKALMR